MSPSSLPKEQPSGSELLTAQQRHQCMAKIFQDTKKEILGDRVPRILTRPEVEVIRRETAEHIKNLNTLLAVHSKEFQHEVALFKARSIYYFHFPRIFRINDLPNEIIANIFRYAVWSVPDVQGGTVWRLWLSWTCRRWRTVALADTTLWSAIWFRDRPPFHQSLAWFDRAGSAPLDLRISNSEKHTFTTDEMDALLERLFSKFSTIRIFIAVVDTWEPILVVLDKVRKAGLTGTPIIMERFELHRTGSPYVQIGSGFEPKSLREPMALFGGMRAPYLKYLSLNGVHIHWDTSILQNLATLDLRRLPLELSPSISRFREILSASPLLWKLCLDGAGPQFDVADLSYPPVLLPNLKILVIADFSPQYARCALSQFTAPQVLDLTVLNLTGDDYSSLFDMFTARFPAVKLLTVYTVELASTQIMVRWLHSMPSLCYLRLANMKADFFDLFLGDPRNSLQPEKEHSAPRALLAPELATLEAHTSVVHLLVPWATERHRLGAPLKTIYITREVNARSILQDPVFQNQIKQLGAMANLRFLLPGARTDEEEEILKRKPGEYSIAM